MRILRNFIWIFGFCLLLYLGDRLGGKVLSQIIRNSKFRYSRLYGKEAAADLLFLGNSRGLSFYQPYIEQITGLSTFNLSYNALPISLGKVLVQDYIELYGKPKKVIIDITLCDRENKALVGQFACYQSFSNRLAELIHQKNASVATTASFSHLFRYNSELFHRALFYQNQSDESWLLDRQITPSLIDKVVQSDYVFHLLYPKSAIVELQELIDDLKEQAIEVKLLVNPYYPSFRRKMSDLDHLIEEVESTTQLPILDYSTIVQKPSLFGDLQHLNVQGAKVYLDTLLAHGVFQ